MRLGECGRVCAHRSRHCLPARPGSCAATLDQRCAPLRVTISVRIWSSAFVHDFLLMPHLLVPMRCRGSAPGASGSRPCSAPYISSPHLSSSPSLSSSSSSSSSSSFSSVESGSSMSAGSSEGAEKTTTCAAEGASSTAGVATSVTGTATSAMIAGQRRVGGPLYSRTRSAAATETAFLGGPKHSTSPHTRGLLTGLFSEHPFPK